MQRSINIMGAGLTGSLLAIFLAKRGYTVNVYEKRADMRKAEVEAGRSINLALSSRGIRALEQAGIAQEVLQYAIPMHGRMLHAVNGSLTYVPYGKDTSEHINSISRSGLNIALLNLAESFENIRLHFSHTLESVDLDKGIACLRLPTGEAIEAQADHTFGTDGAGSIIRQAMEGKGDFEHSLEFLEHGYKELTIPPVGKGEFRMERNALHIWPRGTYMLIALPNLDGSFTCTLFFPNHGERSFDTLKNEQDITDFFTTIFPDTIELIPNLIHEFQHNPIGLLGTVKCYPWHYKDKFLLLGDAAHAVVPFYGQGMNASFEDCLELLPCLQAEDWENAFATFGKGRKPNADAIADLAVENFYEMRDGTARPAFLRMRQLESLLEAQYPDYLSKYSMVTFHPEVPYSVAKSRGNAQNAYLLALCEKHEDLLEINLAQVYQDLSSL